MKTFMCAAVLALATADTVTVPKTTCCDPTNVAHQSTSTTCSVEQQTCQEWITALADASPSWHYKGSAAAKKGLDLATRVCANNADAKHYWIKVNHKNPNGADDYKCARAGDKADGSGAGSCHCCECKDGSPVMVTTKAIGEDSSGQVVTQAIGEDGNPGLGLPGKVVKGN